MRGKAYIDTSMLVSQFVDKKSDANERKSQLEKIRKRYTMVIPQIVIGESIAIILKKTKDPLTTLQEFDRKILDYITDYETQLPALNKEILEHALKLKELQEGYSQLDICDCLIIAHAIVDEDARYLFTLGEIVENIKIINYVNQVREEADLDKVIITDSVK